MDSIINYFKNYQISEKDLGPFLSCLIKREYKANDFIIVEGQVEQYLSFVNNGIVRYFVLANNKESTVDFAFPDTFFCAYDSFYNRKQSLFYIQAITDCELYSIHYDKLQELYANCAIARKLGQVATEYLLTKKVKRELSFLTSTAKERYERLQLKQPKLIQHIPQKYLASYIGVVPETLSRIRKRIN